MNIYAEIVCRVPRRGAVFNARDLKTGSFEKYVVVTPKHQTVYSHEPEIFLVQVNEDGKSGRTLLVPRRSFREACLRGSELDGREFIEPRLHLPKPDDLIKATGRLASKLREVLVSTRRKS